MNQPEIQLANPLGELPCEEDELRSILRRVLAPHHNALEVSVAIVGDEGIKELNRRFLGRTGVTDVIAFTYSSSPELLEGEIVLNAELARRRALETGHGHREELLLYAVHGALHLLGWEDDTPAKRRDMNAEALRILRNDGVHLDSESLLEE
jgi:probable rRNA maturation factor